MHQIEYQGEVVNYAIRRSARAKRLRLTVGEGGIVAVAPPRLPVAQIHQFARQQAAWLLKQQRRQLQRAEQRVASQWPLTQHSQVWLFGLARQLCLQAADAPQTDRFTDQECHLTVDNPLNRDAVKTALIRLYKQHLLQQLPRISAKHVEFLNVNPAGYRVKEQRRQWGSCGKHGHIHINWRLAMADFAILEYVVVHELCHLLERNHSRRFWAHVERCLPDYRTRQRQLRAAEYELMSLP